MFGQVAHLCLYDLVYHVIMSMNRGLHLSEKRES